MEDPSKRHMTREMALAIARRTWPLWEIVLREQEILHSHCTVCAANHRAFVVSLGLDDLGRLEARQRAHSAVTKGLIELGEAFEHDHEARSDFEALKRARGTGRTALLTASPGRFRSPLLVEDLIAEADRHLRRHPARALSWLEIAAEVHRRLIEESGGGGPYDDQGLRIRLRQARAHLALGDRKRAASLQLDLQKARAAKPPPGSRVQKEIDRLTEDLAVRP